VVSIEGLRASMHGEGARRQPGAEAARTGPSDFNVLSDSLRRRVEEIHNQTRLNLPTMESDDGEDTER
jgi:hypothetical protein